MSNSGDDGFEVVGVNKHQRGYEREVQSGPKGERRGDATLTNERVSTPISITLMKIDGAIMKHLSETIKPTIEEEGKQIIVPVRYANAERWKQIREDGALRDASGRVQTPIILLRRTGLRRGSLTNTVNKFVDRTYLTGWNQHNSYDKFAVLNGITPSREMVSVTVPDYVDLTYDFLLWTDYVEQMNPLIELLNFEMDSYWGDRGNFRFKVYVEEYSIDTDVPAEGDRYVKATFQMKVSAYLLPETMMTVDKGVQATNQLRYSNKKVVSIIEVELGKSGHGGTSGVISKEVSAAGSTAVTTSLSIIDVDAVISGAGLFYLTNSGSFDSVAELIRGAELEFSTGHSFQLNPRRVDMAGIRWMRSGNDVDQDWLFNTGSDWEHTIFAVVKPFVTSSVSIINFPVNQTEAVGLNFSGSQFEYFASSLYYTGSGPAIGTQITADIGEWQTIAYTVGPDGNAKQKAYKNGQLAAGFISKSFDINLPPGTPNGNRLIVGATRYVGIPVPDSFTGSIGYMGWWPRELSLAEITAVHDWVVTDGGFAGFLS